MTVPVLKMRDYFDIDALYDALDAQREERGLAWGGVMREINGTYRDVDLRPIAASTITTMRDRDYLNGDGVIQMLLWLDRTPESFVPGHASPNAPGEPVDRARSHRPHTSFPSRGGLLGSR